MGVVWLFTAVVAAAGAASAAYWGAGDECLVDRNGTQVRTTVKRVFGFGVFLLADSTGPERVRISKPDEVCVNVTTADQAVRVIVEEPRVMGARQWMWVWKRALPLSDSLSGNDDDWHPLSVASNVVLTRMLATVPEEFTPDLVTDIMDTVREYVQKTSPQAFFDVFLFPVLNCFRSFGHAVLAGDAGSSWRFVRLPQTPLHVPPHVATWLGQREPSQVGGHFDEHFEKAVDKYHVEVALWASKEHPALVRQAMLSLRTRRHLVRPDPRLTERLREMADSVIVDRWNSDRLVTPADVSTLLLMVSVDWDYSRKVPRGTWSNAVRHIGRQGLLQMDLFEIMVGVALEASAFEPFTQILNDKLANATNDELAAALAALDDCLPEPALSLVNQLDLVQGEFHRKERQDEAGLFGPSSFWGLGAWRVFVQSVSAKVRPSEILGIAWTSTDLAGHLLPLLDDATCDRIVPLLEWRCLAELDDEKAYTLAADLSCMGAHTGFVLASYFETALKNAVRGDGHGFLHYAMMGIRITGWVGDPLALDDLPDGEIFNASTGALGMSMMHRGAPELLSVVDFLLTRYVQRPEHRAANDALLVRRHHIERDQHSNDTRWAKLAKVRRDRHVDRAGRRRAALYLTRFPCADLRQPNAPDFASDIISAIDAEYDALWNSSTAERAAAPRTGHRAGMERLLLPAATLGSLAAAAITFGHGRAEQESPLPAVHERRRLLAPVAAGVIGIIGAVAIDKLLRAPDSRPTAGADHDEDVLDSPSATFQGWTLALAGSILFGIVTCLSAANLAVILGEIIRQPRPRDTVYRPHPSWDWANVANSFTDNDFAAADGWPHCETTCSPVS
ncbi:Transmembrane protein [Plasmodiophora brassicae]